MSVNVFPIPEVSGGKQKKVQTFTASGTWTVPTGVTYAIAYVKGGGGGVGRANTVNAAGAGGNSIVAFSSTVTAEGGAGMAALNSMDQRIQSRSAPANSGQGASFTAFWEAGASYAGGCVGASGAFITAASTVTPGAGVVVTVGAGGLATTSGSAGGSGLVTIEWYE